MGRLGEVRLAASRGESSERGSESTAAAGRTLSDARHDACVVAPQVNIRVLSR